MNYNEVLEIAPFSLDKVSKSKLFDSYLKDLCLMHYEKCENYKKIIDKLECNLIAISHYEDLPFLPVRLFKEFDLKSATRSSLGWEMIRKQVVRLCLLLIVHQR